MSTDHDTPDAQAAFEHTGPMLTDREKLALLLFYVWEGRTEGKDALAQAVTGGDRSAARDLRDEGAAVDARLRSAPVARANACVRLTGESSPRIHPVLLKALADLLPRYPLPWRVEGPHLIDARGAVVMAVTHVANTDRLVRACLLYCAASMVHRLFDVPLSPEIRS